MAPYGGLLEPRRRLQSHGLLAAKAQVGITFACCTEQSTVYDICLRAVLTGTSPVKISATWLPMVIDVRATETFPSESSNRVPASASNHELFSWPTCGVWIWGHVLYFFFFGNR